MLGGGTFTTQNKVLPGTYVNFASVAKASAALSDRGICAMPLPLKWGPTGKVVVVENGDFQKNSLKIFGYAIDADEMLPLREIFAGAIKLITYRLVASDAVKAANTYAEALYPGARGNDLKIKIAANVDTEGAWDVFTYLGTVLVDKQTVTAVSGLVANDYVTFKAFSTLEAVSAAALTGGSDGSSITGTEHQAALDALESYGFNVLGCCSATSTIVNLYAAYTRRMRDEVGAKFQLVAYQSTSADYEGVISVENTASHDTITVAASDLVYWVTGQQAGCAVNASLSNKKYTGELTVGVNYTQTQLENAIKAGKFMFHNVDGEVRVLEDINTLVTVSDTKGDVFKSNQTIRVIDQIANDTAVLFNTRYLGTVPNDNAGRISLWNDICKLHQELEKIRAIEAFDPSSVSVAQGDTKKAVVCTVENLNIVNAMTQLYMSVVIQ